MKKTTTAVAVNGTLPAVKDQRVYHSLKGVAYEQAKTGEAFESQAMYVMENVPGFPGECPDEARAELNAGYRQRKAELMGTTVYAIIDGNYVLASQVPDHKGEKVEVNVDVAMRYSTYEFGKLAETASPQYKGIISKIRDDVSTYCSNKFKELTRQANSIINAGKSRKRGATKTFDDALKATFDDYYKRVRNAAKRGDPTANEKRFSEAKVAFFAVWNHAE